MSRLSTGFVTMEMRDDVISFVGFDIRDESFKKTLLKITRPSDRVAVSLSSMCANDAYRNRGSYKSRRCLPRYDLFY